MARIFQHVHTVTPEEIDGQGHANNIAYLSWMQDAAVRHSNEQGWTAEDYRQRGWSWVVRSHFIQYRRPAFPGDEILVRTWVADMKKFTSLRKFEILLSDELLARAETNWAFVDVLKQALMAIPQEVASAFEVVEQPTEDE